MVYKGMSDGLPLFSVGSGAHTKSELNLVTAWDLPKGLVGRWEHERPSSSEKHYSPVQPEKTS